MIAALTAVWTLTPQPGSTREDGAQYRAHTIYLGHLRHRAPEDLAEALRITATGDPFPMLARQPMEMSRRNWTKHRKFQCSLSLSAAGLLAFAYAVLQAVRAATP